MDEYALTYFILLEHAIVIQTREILQDITVTMIPQLTKEERRKVIGKYMEIIDGSNTSTSAIIEKDRAELRKLLSKSK